MEHKKYTFEFFEKYLDGNLSDEDKKAFEVELSEDADLQTRLETHRQGRKASDVYAQIKTKEKVKNIFDQQRQAKRPWISRTWSIAAGIALLVVGGSLFFYMSSQYTDQALATNYLSPYPDRITAMGDHLDKEIEAAMKAYNQEDYQKALELFSNLPPDYAQIELIQIYKAICLLKLDESKAAINILNAIEGTSPLYTETVRWYLALAYLRDEQTMQARTILEQIHQSDGYQAEAAKQLLNKLDSFWRN